MIKRLLLLFLATTMLSGCSGYLLGDVLQHPGATDSRQTVPITIGVKVTPQKDYPYYVRKSKSLERTATTVFNQYGWKVVHGDNAPIVVELTDDFDQYCYPGFTLLYFAGLGTLPAKFENYYSVNASVSINGAVQDNFSYTANVTEYMTCYGPIGLLMPGVTTRAFMEPLAPEEISQQAIRLALQNIAEDIKAQYISGNYQRTDI